MTIEEIIRCALQEDLGSGDHTSRSTIPATAVGKSRLLVKEDGVIAGVEIAKQVFFQLDPSLYFEVLIPDGSKVRPGDIVFYISGSSRNILSGERLALNFMQRMSGIATATRHLVKLVEGTGCVILDTRKTTPLLREIEKTAVRLGGGQNHRIGLYDMIMIKDNHVDFAGGIEKAIDAVHDYLGNNALQLKIEIEVRNFIELQQVLDHNFQVPDLAMAVKIIGKSYETEASGGINITNIRQYAETGVDYISVGALTHHINSLDISLKAVL
jgi:nicotinate-nucleotide pyrophosphorylase (carboxylating)